MPLLLQTSLNPAIVSPSPDALLKQGPPNVRVNGAERVVEQIYIGILVHRSSQRDTLLLAARESDATVADLCQVSVGEDLKVRGQLGGVEGLAVPSEAGREMLLHTSDRVRSKEMGQCHTLVSDGS